MPPVIGVQQRAALAELFAGDEAPVEDLHGHERAVGGCGDFVRGRVLGPTEGGVASFGAGHRGDLAREPLYVSPTIQLPSGSRTRSTVVVLLFPAVSNLRRHRGSHTYSTGPVRCWCSGFHCSGAPPSGLSTAITVMRSPDQVTSR